MKKTLILIAGPPATGKSYFIKCFGREIPNFKFVSPDILKEKLADQYGYKNKREKDELEKIVWKMYYDKLFAYMSRSKKIILSEYPFSYKQKEHLEKLCSTFKYQVITVRLYADFEVLWKRRIVRDLEDDRHLSHITNSYYKGMKMKREDADALITKSEFKDIIESRQYNNFRLGKLYAVNVTEFEKVNYEKIISAIKKDIK